MSRVARRTPTRVVGAAALLVLLLTSGTSLASNEFPLREEYSDLQPIETSELAGDYDQYLIIDVRSESEFDVIHMVAAHNVPVALEKTFVSSLEKLAGTHRRPIVMYCNGVTCAKSYKAARIAVAAGFSAVRVYDSGIMHWGKAMPQKTALLGQSPLDPAKLLSKGDLARHTLSRESFLERASRDGAMVFDVREAIQRDDIPDLPGVESKKIVLTRFTNYVGRERFKKQAAGQTIYVFDAVGRQVRWVQYYLEASGIEDYYFLEGGAKSIESAPANAGN